MSTPTYVVLSRQSGLASELTNIANNIANADTTGFRREAALYSEFVRALDANPSVSQTRVAGRFLDARSGDIGATGGRLDFALEGEGFFVVATPSGERLTRAGAFTLDAEGALSTPDGHAVSGEGGSTIVIPPDVANVVVSSDGVVSVDGAPTGRIAVAIAAPETLERVGADLFRSTAPIEYAADGRIRQGFLERSNVDAVAEIGRLIEVQRAFELGQQLLDDDHARIRRVIDAVGRR